MRGRCGWVVADGPRVGVLGLAGGAGGRRVVAMAFRGGAHVVGASSLCWEDVHGKALARGWLTLYTAHCTLAPVLTVIPARRWTVCATVALPAAPLHLHSSLC